MCSARNQKARESSSNKKEIHKSDKHEFGTEFYISKRIVDNFLVFEPVNETFCNIRVKLKYYNLILILALAQTEENDEIAKEEFYRSLEKLCDAVPNKT
jgi:hypothetical protein